MSELRRSATCVLWCTGGRAVVVLGALLASSCATIFGYELDGYRVGAGGTMATGGALATGAVASTGATTGTGGYGTDASSGSGGTSGNGGAFDCMPIDWCADPTPFAGATTGPERLIYPYADTLFPQGLDSPTFQWETTATDAELPSSILFELKSTNWSFRECLAAQAPTSYKIQKFVWDAQAYCAKGSTDPVTVTLTILTGGEAHTLSTSIKFAASKLRVGLYYDTYQSPLAGNTAAAIMKLNLGATSPTGFLTQNGTFPFGPCHSCHSVSSAGTVMTADNHQYPAGPYNNELYTISSATPTLLQRELGFAAVHPGGAVLLTSGPASTSTSGLMLFPSAAGQPAGLIGPTTSRLLDVVTGADITPSSWTTQHANMPMFSPDGRHLVYNDQDQNGSHSLWVVDFDVASKAFSNTRQIFNDATRYPGWPSFTPDSENVVFVLGTSDTFSSQTPSGVTFVNGPVAGSHLMIVDVATGQATPLSVANGYRGGTSYLQTGDNDLEFYSSVSPVAAGGYFWVFFMSRRSYGNVWSKGKDDMSQRKIWAAALDIGAPPGTDPSHPPFYLEGQELTTGNTRPTAALEPCKEDGSSCEAGSECCRGYCTGVDPSSGLGVCGMIQVNQCARVDDRCVTTADCCAGPTNGANGASLSCIAGYCAQIGN